MIVWLVSYPRSGNTFFRILLNSLYGIETYSIHNDSLFDRLEGSKSVVGHKKLDKDIEALAQEETLHFIKTHYLPSIHDSADQKFPAIYLLRDGRDSIVSYARYILSFSDKQPHHKSFKHSLFNYIFSYDLDDAKKRRRIMKDLILSSDDKFGNWSESVTQWAERDAPLAIVRYEDLVLEPQKNLYSTLLKLNLSISVSSGDPKSKVPSFEDLNNRWPAFFRKGKKGNWRKEMDGRLQNLFWRRHGKLMEKFNYPRL